MLLLEFRNYLISSGKSAITAKNYASDINKFFKWFHDNFSKAFTPDDISPDLIDLFIKTRGGVITPDNAQIGPSVKSFQQSDTSDRSFERYISSLKMFAKFLTSEDLIDRNPFEDLSKLDTQNPHHNNDPWKIKDFKNHLYVTGAASITSKNYLLDINAFTTWLTTTGEVETANIDFSKISSQVIDEYKERLISVLSLSPSSVNRKLSSIRKYLSFLRSEGLMESNQIYFPNYQQENLDEEKTLSLEDFTPNIIPEEEISTESSIPPVRLLNKLAAPYIAFEDSISGRIAASIKAKKLKDKAFSFKDGSEKEKVLPSVRKDFYKKPEASLNNMSLGKKIIYHARFTRPNWYKRYHSIQITHYIHLGILMLYVSVIGMIIYGSFFKEPATNNFALARNLPSGKTLSFAGVLKDQDNNPITEATKVRFQIYDDSEASGAGHLLWQEVNNVKPSQNGSFTQILGDGGACDTDSLTPINASCQIPEDVFTQHSRLYIGMSIEDQNELTPRQELTQVAFAANTKMLSGMLPITDTSNTSNVILALDSSGNLTIGGNASPAFTATGGQFKISGQPLLLTTNEGSNSDVHIIPDGNGRIDLQKPIVNNSSFGSLSPGAVEFDDKVVIQATESAVAAFVINNNTTGGDIFTASSSGTARFTIANNGDISLQPGVSIDTTSFGSLKIGGKNASNISLGRIGQGITLPGFTTSGGLLYTNGIGELAQVPSGTEGKCLVANGTQAPSWNDCQDKFFHYNQGALVFNNLNGDFLIGGESTSAAKFAFYNVSSGIPTAAIHGNINILSNNGVDGRLAIGTTDPQALIHVKSYQDTNVLRLEDQDGICDHNPEAGVEIVTCSSDQRLKTDITDATGALDDLMKLKIRDYIVKASGQKLTGVIAQEVQQDFPDMVHTNSEGYLMVETPSIWKVVLAIQEVASKLTNITTNSLAVATDSVTIAGKNLNAYIIEVVQAAQNDGTLAIRGQIISPLASIDTLKTNVISPLGSDRIKINGKVVIAKNPTATDSAVLEVDGDASISGTLTSNEATISGTLAAGNIETNNLQTTNATISGTLYADNIQANSISGLDSRIASIAAQNLASNQPATVSADLIAGIVNSQLSNLTASLPTFSTNLIDVSNLYANFATFRDGLISLGPATFGEATFLDGISIGTRFVLGQNSIDTLGQDLEIQPLKQGAISFMGGSVKIGTDGNLKVIGNAKFASNVEVSGKLSANVISPLAKKNLIISGNDDTSSTSAADDNLVDVRGSISASGSATFNKLNISLVEPAYALSDVEVVATGSAGTATIKRYRTELTVDNALVTPHSLIYITPVGSTNNQTIYLLRQVAGRSFTAGVGTPALADIKFNWIIVN